MLTVRVDDRVRLWGDLDRAVVLQLQQAFSYPNPDYDKAKVFGFYQRVPKYLVSWRTRGTGQDLITIARGGYDRVCAVLNQAGIPYRVEDVRVVGQPGQILPQSKMVPRAYQERLITRAQQVLRDGRAGVCLWRSPQASGKTCAAIILAIRLQLKTLVVVSNRVLLRQWCNRIETDLGIRPGVVGGGRYDLAPAIVVAMQQSLKNMPPEDMSQFGLLIGDEIQLFAARTFQESVDRFAGLYRLGVSGDERRADRKECLIYDQFGPVAAEVSSDELVSIGQIHEVQVRVVPTQYRCDWWTALGQLSPTKNESFDDTVRRRIKARVRAFDQLSEELGADVGRNTVVVQLVQGAVAEVGQCLVLSSRRSHCHRLDAALQAVGLSSGLLIGGEDYRDQFERTLRLFAAGTLQAAVGTYQAIGVGFDLPSVARGVFASPVAGGALGDKQWRQYRGRFARTSDGKHDAVIYYLWDVDVFGLKPLRHLRRWNDRVVVQDGPGWIQVKDWIQKWQNPDGKTAQRHANPARSKRDLPTGPVTEDPRPPRSIIVGGGGKRGTTGSHQAIPRSGQPGDGAGLGIGSGRSPDQPKRLRKRSEVGNP